MASLKQDRDMETICCTLSRGEDVTVDETDRALELIRKLSFDTGDASNANRRGKNPNVSSVSVCSAPTIMAALPVLKTDYSSPPRREQSEGDANLATSPPGLPLPPRIQRMEDAHSVISLPEHIPQVMHNRNRLRSTSLSEMSDSCRLGFAHKEDYDGDDEEMDDDQADASSLNSFGSYSSKSSDGEDKVVLSTIDDVFHSASIALSPPLHPSSGPRAPMLLNRGRTSTMTSDLSSYLSPSSSSSSSCPSDDDDASEEDSTSSYEEDHQRLNDPPGFYEANFRSQPWHREDGYLSLPECTGPYAPTCEHSANYGVTTRHRLSSEALREWNRLCEEEEYPEVTGTKHQHIWRALSCPDIQAMTYHCDKVEVVKAEDHVDDVVPTHLMAKSEDEEDALNRGERAVSPGAVPHLLADGALENLPMSHAPSRSIFSYTNSYSPSTITSGISNVDEISHLDFDITFIYPREIEIIHNPELADISDVPKKGKHRRSRSSMGLTKPLNAKKTFAGTKRRHRRHKSDNILVDQAAPSTPRRLLSLTDIAEDVKSVSNSSNINSSDRNLLNILSQSLEKESIKITWDRHREKICYFALGAFAGISVQYLLQR
jgi:hypothetical protein